jgi:hypothetical protein
MKRVNWFQVGDIVRTTKGCRVRKAQPAWSTQKDTREDDIEILEVGRFWRNYPAVVGMNLRRGTKHIFLEKNLVHVNSTKGYQTTLDATPQVTQSQESLYDQMIQGIEVVNRFGLYDLADYLQARVNEHDSNYYG